ncbi:MAG: glycerol-3-phosphate 1-O-acyltransferase PlsY [Oligoflexia bacterium]|nr:glycerol-3-phosphate 1-O-acyltransferase PlsY [Oligoflexia bacterium]
MTVPIVIAFVSFVIGSIPSGILLAKIFQLEDPRTKGSGNIGAANMTRIGGKKIGILTFVLDFLKGLISVLLVKIYFPGEVNINISCFSVIAGHCFSLFLFFKGGKGVATAAGALVLIFPQSFLISFVIWGLMFYIFRITSISALIAFLLFPFIQWVLGYTDLSLTTSILVSLLIIQKHQTNIVNLLDQKEYKFQKSSS